MDPNPIRPTRGKARGRPVLPPSLGSQSGQPQDNPSFQSPRPMQPNVQAQPLQPTRSIQQPISSVGMARPPRQPLARPAGPSTRTPRPMGPKPEGGGDVASSTVGQSLSSEVRGPFILLNTCR